MDNDDDSDTYKHDETSDSDDRRRRRPAKTATTTVCNETMTTTTTTTPKARTHDSSNGSGRLCIAAPLLLHCRSAAGTMLFRCCLLGRSKATTNTKTKTTAFTL